MKEIWKPIRETDFYEISNKARLRSYRRTGGGRTESASILMPHDNGRGYYFFCVVIKGGKTTRRRSRLVAEAFVPNPDNKPEVNHIDGDKANDMPNNLEWCTPSENIRHAFKTGLMDAQRGEERYNSKLTKDDVIEIRYVYENNPESTHAKLANKYNVSKSLIYKVVNYESWSHI